MISAGNTINSQKNWYAVYTIVRHEKSVCSSLLNKEIDTYLPIREVVNRWKDRNKKVSLPLFPGYLFVNLDVRDKMNVLTTKGVVRMLGINGDPTPIPDEQVNSIKNLLESNLRYDPYQYIAEGREVEVVNGPLAGTKGRILQRRGQYRLILSVDLIQRAVSVEVDIDDVELV